MSDIIRSRDGRFVKGVRYSPNTEFKKGTHWRSHAIFREKDYLIEKYVVEQMSTSEIAKKHGVTDSAVIFWLRKHKISRRTVKEARKIKKWSLSGDKNGMFGRTGNKNPNWVDGSSPERQSNYSRSFWKQIVKKVLQRDNYKCQRCGSDVKLQAHHIKPWAGNKELRFELTNIITLCKCCHIWVHSKLNFLKEFLA